jgi:hypothetical protein
MTMPGDFNVVTVRGNYVSFDGAPLSGQVYFTPSVPYLTSPSAKSVILTRPIVGAVVNGVLRNADGSGDLRLFATDDPDVDRQGWTYAVREDLGPGSRAVFNISVPLTAEPAGLDLYALATSAPPVTPGVSYVPLPAFTSLSGRVAALETDTSGAASATPHSLLRRDEYGGAALGYLSISAMPTNPENAVRKDYVDGLIAALVARIEALESA